MLIVVAGSAMREAEGGAVVYVGRFIALEASGSGMVDGGEST